MCVVLCTGTTDRDKQLYITNSSNMQMHRNQTQHLVAVRQRYEPLYQLTFAIIFTGQLN